MEEVKEPESSKETPFKEVDQEEVLFDGEEDLFKDEVLILDDDDYFEIENAVESELESIDFWLKEVEKQRTSTVEKNMMEIFEEFKKGVEEKIGQQDYDTRYNLGIAYKEMGLIEEAIHEFLISSKHPLKFFDSAGLLGICFREKGMYEDSLVWLEKALDSPDRMKEEYLAIRYEIVATYLKMENYQLALKTTEDIMDENPKFRNVSEIYDKLKKNI
jgi:tetratricopeptide (TPR) repeat protein